MDSLEKLQRRKAELKAQMESEREALKKTLLEARDEIEPANLLKKAVSGLLDFSKNKSETGQSDILKHLPGPLGFVASLFIKDPKWAFLVKTAITAALRFFPKNPAEKVESAHILNENVEKPPEKPLKSKMYGHLRRGVSALRKQLKNPEKPDEKSSEQTQI